MTDLRLVGANTVPGAAANEYEIGGAYRIAPHVHDNLKLGFLMHRFTASNVLTHVMKRYETRYFISPPARI